MFYYQHTYTKHIITFLFPHVKKQQHKNKHTPCKLTSNIHQAHHHISFPQVKKNNNLNTHTQTNTNTLHVFTTNIHQTHQTFPHVQKKEDKKNNYTQTHSMLYYQHTYTKYIVTPLFLG
eukprot:TRINITY_DN15699_c0_g1_i1.p1 TRINITY_DN15699_c0_g1~~TRINITY_DN15699_c0_g1_i1.p1  ORF type:complete len:119 (-),score=16.22 TRINITY_DN15699_c0_g1_i1:50-406(-)